MNRANLPFKPTIVWRHRKENLKKCTLRGLEKRNDFLFYTYPKDPLPDLTDYILLTVDAPPLTIDDANRGLFVIDATWRYAERMSRQLPNDNQMVKRSLPGNYFTAYPRRQDDCIDPERGLASIEAIFVAYNIMGWPTEGLLDDYHWKNEFLSQF